MKQLDLFKESVSILTNYEEYLFEDDTDYTSNYDQLLADDYALRADNWHQAIEFVLREWEALADGESLSEDILDRISETIIENPTGYMDIETVGGYYLTSIGNILASFFVSEEYTQIDVPSAEAEAVKAYIESETDWTVGDIRKYGETATLDCYLALDLNVVYRANHQAINELYAELKEELEVA